MKGYTFLLLLAGASFLFMSLASACYGSYCNAYYNPGVSVSYQTYPTYYRPVYYYTYPSYYYYPSYYSYPSYYYYPSYYSYYHYPTYHQYCYSGCYWTGSYCYC
jgi:hypothetical protein